MRRKRNLDGYMEGGVFHPIRGSAGYDDEKLGSIDFNFGANVPQKRGRGRPKGPTQKTLEKKRREYEERNRKRDLRERLARRRELASFVRRSGGIRYDGMHDGEIKRLGRHESGTSGLVSVDRGKGLQRRAGRGFKPDTMREHAVEAGLIPASMSISDFLRAVEHSATVRNPKKKNAGFEDTRRITHKLGIPQGSQVAFTVDRNGKPIAYKYSTQAMRWIRVGYDEAKIAVSTGKAREVRKNPKGKPARKPLAREWGESDSGTQPTLFIKGDKKHAGQETFEELFHRAEQEAKGKKSNPFPHAAVEKAWQAWRKAEKAKSPKAQELEFKFVKAYMANKKRITRKNPRKRNFTIKAAGRLKIGNPGVARVKRLYEAKEKARQKYEAAMLSGSTAKRHAAHKVFYDAEKRWLTALDAAKGKWQANERFTPVMRKPAKRIPKKVRGAKRKNPSVPALSTSSIYQLFLKSNGAWVFWGAYGKLSQARSAAKSLSNNGHAVKIVSGQTQKEIKPRRKNVSVKIGGKTRFKAGRKGVSIGGRVKLTANGLRKYRRMEKIMTQRAKPSSSKRSTLAGDKYDIYPDYFKKTSADIKKRQRREAARPGHYERLMAGEAVAQIQRELKAAGKIRPKHGPFRKKQKARNGIFERFHGRRATKTTSLNAPDGTPKRLEKLGKLVSLHAAGGTIKPNGSTVWLCSDQKGRLHLATSGARLIDGPAQNFGEVKKIEYETTKTHLDGKPAIYYHFFGEEGGKRPTLMSDGKGGLRLRGGSYKIRAEGIRD